MKYLKEDEFKKSSYDYDFHKSGEDIFTFSDIDIVKSEDGTKNLSQFNATLSKVNVIDAHGDQMLSGAFDKAIKMFGRTKLPVLYKHDQYWNVGHWSKLRMDGDLLKATGHLYIDEEWLPEARKVSVWVRKQTVRGVSIGGWAVKKSDYIQRKNGKIGRDIEEVELGEASLVMSPANTSARVLRKEFDLETPELDKILKELRG